MKNKEILFHSERSEFDILKPYPASKDIPEWFKNTPPVAENDLTARRCIPLLDSFSAGYMIPLFSDVYFNEENDSFVSKSVIDVTSSHPKFQVEKFEIDSSFNPQPFKWLNPWYIKTPKGYSTMFIHPLNRTDLPFYSLTGIVDTDKHPLETNFPFFMKKGFSGEIKAGTPVIQAIPFKRDDWSMKIKDDESYNYEPRWSWFNPPMAKYRRMFWSRKKYE